MLTKYLEKLSLTEEFNIKFYRFLLIHIFFLRIFVFIIECYNEDGKDGTNVKISLIFVWVDNNEMKATIFGISNRYDV